MRLYDENGTQRALLGAKKNVPMITLDGENGHATLGSPEGGPGLWLSDSKGNDRVKMVGGKGGSSLGLFSENNKLRMWLAVFEDNSPHLGLLDGDGSPRVTMQIGKGGGGMVDISNALGKRVASIQADKKNCGNVMVSDQNGEPKQFLTAD